MTRRAYYLLRRTKQLGTTEAVTGSIIIRKSQDKNLGAPNTEEDAAANEERRSPVKG